jgi:hypothetical protein
VSAPIGLTGWEEGERAQHESTKTYVLSRSRGDGVADPKDANLGELGHELDGFASEGGAANQAEGLEVRRELGELIYMCVLERWDG